MEEVFFDLAGFPAVLRSDRGKAFLSEVVRAVNDYLGVVQAFGSSYHPESQGYLEARHKPINNVLAAYCRQFPGQWSRWIKLAQWAMRSTPRADRCGKSPYEIVTGLIPQGPIDELFAKHANTRFVDPGSYVAALHENLKHIHTCVREQLEAELENKHAKAERDGVPQVPAKVGDMVFLRRPPPELQRGEVSKRFLPKANPQLYRVQKLVSAQAVILEDPDTHSTDLGFAQPIAISRLILFDMQDLEAPVSTQQDLSLELWDGKEWRSGRVIQQNATGSVRIRWDSGDETLHRLENEEYRWLERSSSCTGSASAPESVGAAPSRRRLILKKQQS